ncbi:TrbI/VirB10 family protein [Vibrio chagasii]|uniref:TrbI/VirB10 family protein n=1 Tax=Vibrio chagasii TaxID=170679 RepID=UPI002284C9EF|nr:TrbI/VirB10 family protein [Vibrio chagasii]MCY9828835.1 conjugal transfer protein [Vibrio chagasii]
MGNPLKGWTKKTQIGVFCSCLGILVTVVVVAIFNKDKPAESLAEPTTVETVPVSVEPTNLGELVTARDQAKDSTEALTNQRPEPKPRIEVPVLSVIDQEREKIKLAEFRRAKMASMSVWGQSPRAPSVSSAPLRVPADEHTPDHLLSSEAQRLDISRKLSKLNELKAKIKAGNYSAGDQAPETQAVARLESSFSKPPETIVGFTQENTYNASTEGLEKLPIGTVIPAVTVMKANSDRAGTFKAVVSQSVFDVTEQYILIPKGSEVIIKSVRMSTTNEAINAVLGMSVPWIILPDGKKIDTSKSSGMDREGMAGISDQVDHHWIEQFMGVAAYALVADNTSYDGTGDSDGSYQGEVSQGLRDQVAPHAQKYLQLVPTTTIRAGQSMNIMIESDIYLAPWRNLYEDYL